IPLFESKSTLSLSTILPESGVRSPAMDWSVRVLPLPEGPKSTTNPSGEEKAAFRTKRLPREASVFSISTRMSISGFLEAIREKDLPALPAQHEIDESHSQVFVLRRTHNRDRV